MASRPFGGGRKSTLVPINTKAAPPEPDSGLGTPCISSASTDSSSGGSSGRRRRANQPLRTSSSDDDSAEDTSSCASSTCQVYRRAPGFLDHAHAHPVQQHRAGGGRLKEKRALLQQQQQLPSVAPVAASVPMRSRHLPKSMWQEPDEASYSPATLLPRLALHRSVDDVSELGLTGSSPFRNRCAAGGPLKPPIRTVLNLDPSECLQRKLFEVALKPPPAIEQQKKQQQLRPTDRLQPIAQRPPVGSKSSFLSNNDPCLSDCNKFPYLGRTGLAAAVLSDSSDCLHQQQPLQQQLQQQQQQQQQQHRDSSPTRLLAEVAKQL
ncbi:hypothetical protein BOX15_Mlig015399g1 [Macrostomum lignano]|uniref:Uncharacterized protein n=2 Tax=Macrostomum lignano TaxID=282301 RepID=A0A267GQX7_9PLAT|nr:hypothetical protein BOX15_Mlig027663g1 [Macrostomum lignano]PAA87814.1 hypothetical protein BOX15_Mlig015399g1 [Macrostomum lignano]